MKNIETRSLGRLGAVSETAISLLETLLKIQGGRTYVIFVNRSQRRGPVTKSFVYMDESGINTVIPTENIHKVSTQ
jgi:hypothetical protein